MLSRTLEFDDKCLLLFQYYSTAGNFYYTAKCVLYIIVHTLNLETTGIFLICRSTKEKINAVPIYYHKRDLKTQCTLLI